MGIVSRVGGTKERGGGSIKKFGNEGELETYNTYPCNPRIPRLMMSLKDSSLADAKESIERALCRR